jgi:hypothetical protein
MIFSTKIILIAIILMIPVTIKDILKGDLFQISLDIIIICINTLTVILDIISTKRRKKDINTLKTMLK